MELNYIFYADEYPQAYKYVIANNYTIREIEADDKGRRFQIIEIPMLTEEEQVKEEIQNLKQKLADMDYKSSKYVDGEYTNEEWAEIVTERKTIRERIRELEKIII